MSELELLQHFSYALFFLAVIAYATLDGFDLGVGCLHLLARTDRERRIFLNAIGPVWDGNSVWIVIAVGILLSAFPHAFAEIMSGFYLPTIFLIFAFMLRAVAVEFRSKLEMGWWRALWDTIFSLASLLLTFDLGMIIGNIIAGVPLDPQGQIIKNELFFITPFTLLVGILNVALFTMHGSIYLTMKTEGKLQDRICSLVPITTTVFVFFWMCATFMTIVQHPHMFERFKDYPALIVVAILTISTITLISLLARKEWYFAAFIASCGSIALLTSLVGIGIYPKLLPSTFHDTDSLTLFNSSAGIISLKVITIVALIGSPFVFFYLPYIYRTFRGHVVIDDHISY